MFERVDVAAISFVPKKFGLEDNAEQLEMMFRQAAAGGAQLALAPEGVLEGYVVMDVIEGRVPAEEMRQVAVSTRSALVDRFRSLARELKMRRCITRRRLLVRTFEWAIGSCLKDQVM